MIEFRGCFDQSVMFALLRFQMRKIRVVLYIVAGFFCALGALIVTLSHVSGDLSNQFTGWFLLIAGILYYPAVFLLARSMQKKQNNSNKILGIATTTYYVFNEFGFYSETVRGNEMKATLQQAYSTLHKVAETQSYYFLYIANAQAHVIKKSDLVSGTTQQLSAILATALPATYKFYNIK